MKRAWSRKNLWERSPRWLKRVVGAGLGAVPLSWILGRRFRERHRFILSAQRWSADRVRAYQVEQLKRILTLAYERTSYYRRTFDEAGFDPHGLREPEDLRRLPTIDRTTLTEHLGDMLTCDAGSPGVDYVTTGGTSGSPLAFYIGAGRSSLEYAHLTAAWSRVGFSPGDTLAVFRGRLVGEEGAGLRHEYDPLLRQHFYSAFHLTDEMMARYVEHVRGIGPCFLHVYPSSADALARFIRRCGVRPPDNIRGILAESEIVYPEQRRLSEDVFQCRYFSCYGHTEKLVLAAECEHSTDDHVDPFYGYAELLDESGRPITEAGRRGEIVGTGYINTVVPFIRYRTGDFAELAGEGCAACGRAYLRLRGIAGHRTQEMLIASDGSAIAWTAVNMHDDTFDRVRRFQFHQRRPGQAVLRIVPAAGFGPADLRRIREHLGRKLSGRLTIEPEVCEDIPLTARGKATYVVADFEEADTCASTHSTSSR
ncbi:MAG: capsular polysaccharide biosynthesis protein CapK [Planctomycetota bacterium]|nr:MAG: capsular polysaccharide biosynthesis protein CapK [Planctomycetota bacterium]